MHRQHQFHLEDKILERNLNDKTKPNLEVFQGKRET